MIFFVHYASMWSQFVTGSFPLRAAAI
jgi:hypothetical protein